MVDDAAMSPHIPDNQPLQRASFERTCKCCVQNPTDERRDERWWG
jgi:hypothetical protein